MRICEKWKVIFIILSLLLVSVSLASCSPSNSASSLKNVTVAYSPFESTALLWVAKQEGYFERNGISVILRKYNTGAASLDGVISGEAEIAVGLSEFPVVKNAFEGTKISIIANADKGEFIYLVGRKDRNINTPPDLKNKRIGVAKGTIAEYFLGSLLEMNGMSIHDIDMVDLRTSEEWVSAVFDGEVDAVVVAQPDANTVRERLGDNAFFWSAQGGQFLHGLIVATNNWIDANPEIISKFLKSVAEAEVYAEEHPNQAQDILKVELGFNEDYVETIWAQNEFSVSLDESLIIAMEDEARWMISSELTQERIIPNFLDYVNTSGLKQIKPERVRISGK